MAGPSTAVASYPLAGLEDAINGAQDLANQAMNALNVDEDRADT